MEEPLEQRLNAIARGFTLSRELPLPADSNPRQVALKLTAPPGALDQARMFIATIVETLDIKPVTTTRTVLKDLSINLKWLTKDVRFKVKEIENQEIIGGMPVADEPNLTLTSLTAGPLSKLTDGSLDPPGVPGVLGSLSGTFQLPIDETTVSEPNLPDIGTSHPISVEVRVAVMSERGEPMPVGHYGLHPGTSFSEVPGHELVLTGEDAKKALQGLHLVLPAVFVDQSNQPTPTVTRSIRVTLRLAAAGVVTEQVQFPPLNVAIPTIPVPAALFLFENVGYSGRTFVALPSNSPINPEGAAESTNLAGFLELLETALRTLRPPGANSPPEHPFLALLADSQIRGLRPVEGQIKFAKADRIANLDDYPFQGGSPGFGRSSPEDMAKSLIFIGAPNRRVQLFNDRSFDYRQGQIDIVLGPELFTAVLNLKADPPVSDHAPNRVSVIYRPGGMRGLFHSIWSFYGEISSLMFGFGQ